MSSHFISVIVPVYNAEEQVRETLSALEGQTYDRDRYEVIVVDNGSTDGTLAVIDEFKGVRLFENNRSKNPYVSRNIGVDHSKGDIIAFLDVTCTPSAGWLEEGIEMIRDGADLVGGKIEYTFSENPTLGEWYDSITFVDVKNYIEKFGSAAGGNLFVMREVWETMGPFPENGRSGMDIYWTRKATERGFELGYSDQAIVYYPARRLRGVVVKSYRVGKGHSTNWKHDGRPLLESWIDIVKTFSPPSIADLKRNIEERGKPEMMEQIYLLWGIRYLCKMAMAAGRFSGMIRFRN